MIRRLVLLLLVTLPAWAQDPAPLLLRLVVEQHGAVWVGQRVTVTLTVMTPVRFVDPVPWPDITASDGRVIVLPEAATLPGTERIGGESYAALSRSYTIFPATPGELVLAPMTVGLRVGGPDGQPLLASASTEATTLTARAPPGVTDLRRLVVAPSFAMQAQVDGNAGQIHVGDAVTRTVTMQAGDTAAMMLPPVRWEAPEDVRIYPDPPVLQDHSERGALRALRRERAAFVPQRSGRMELPGFSVSWLDPRHGQVRQVMVDPVRLEILPAAAPTPTSRRIPWGLAAGGGAAALAVAALTWWLLRRRRAAGPDRLRALRQACRADDPRAALRALYRWADDALPPGGERTIGQLAALSATPDLLVETGRLEAMVFGGADGPWSGAAVADAARRADRRLRGRVAQHDPAALPPLNPAPARMPPPRLAQPRWVR